MSFSNPFWSSEGVIARASSLERGALATVIVGVPLLFARFLHDPINVPKLALLVLGLGVAAACRVVLFAQGQRPSWVLGMAVPFSALTLPLALSWALDAERGWSMLGQYGRFQGLAPYLAVALLATLVALAFAERPERLAFLMTLAGGLVGAYGLVQVVGLDPFEWAVAGTVTNRATSSLGNPNFTGGLLGIIMPTALVLVLTRRDENPWLVRLGVALLAGWVLSFSQGGWAAGAAGSAVAVAYVYRDRVRAALSIGWATAAAVFAVAVGVVILSFSSPGSPLVSDTALLRGYWWRAAWDMFTESPLIGSGPNAFALGGFEHRLPADAARFWFDFANDPHSVLLSLLTAAGVVGGIGLLVLGAWVVRMAVRSGTDPLVAGFVGSCVAYFVQSMVSIDELSLRVMFWTAIGGLGAAALAPRIQAKTIERGKKRSKTKPARAKRSSTPVRAPAFVLAAALLPLASLAWSVPFLIADARMQAARVNAINDRIDLAIPDYRSAVGLRADPEYRRFFGFDTGRAAVQENSSELFSIADGAFAYTEDFADVFGLRERGKLLYDWAEEGSGDQTHLERSLAAYRRALELDPLNPALRIETADVLLALDKPGEALETLRPALNLPGEPHWVLLGAVALSQAQLGNDREALEAANRALYFARDERAEEALRLVRDASG